MINKIYYLEAASQNPVGCQMLPNLFPIVVVFGSLGLLQIQIDLGMIITASIALGIAGDDTLHVLTWYRRAPHRSLG